MIKKIVKYEQVGQIDHLHTVLYSPKNNEMPKKAAFAQLVS
jgi:hypothetical protein